MLKFLKNSTVAGKLVVAPAGNMKQGSDAQGGLQVYGHVYCYCQRVPRCFGRKGIQLGEDLLARTYAMRKASCSYTDAPVSPHHGLQRLRHGRRQRSGRGLERRAVHSVRPLHSRLRPSRQPRGAHGVARRNRVAPGALACSASAHKLSKRCSNVSPSQRCAAKFEVFIVLTFARKGHAQFVHRTLQPVSGAAR
jgi:hypothetical protein